MFFLPADQEGGAGISYMSKELLPYILIFFGFIFALGGPRGYSILSPYINILGIIMLIAGIIVLVVYILKKK